MHLAGIQNPDLYVALWRSTLQCSPSDNIATWDWAVFRSPRVWQAHGDIVAATRPYLPGSFDRPPRNIAEKLTSGYKAVEFMTYLYGLGPAILLGVLPFRFWRNICKLIQGIRLMNQYESEGVSAADLAEAHQLLVEFVVEFEDLYYQGKASRLHFCRQSVHAHVHLGPETENTGPYPIKSQWPIERTIGILGSQIRQPSKPFANMAQRAIRRCQVNALKHMFPDIDPDIDRPLLPRGAYDIGDGYALLRYADRNDIRLANREAGVLRDFVRTRGLDVHPDWLAQPTVRRWARIQLPNGQIARAWKELEKPLDMSRYSRMVKVVCDDRIEIAEVQFYFLLKAGQDEDDRQHGFAMVSMWSPPDPQLLEWSSKCLWSCLPLPKEDDRLLRIISAKNIIAAVGMVPHSVDIIEDPELRNRLRGRWYMVPHLGQKLSSMAGAPNGDEGNNGADDGGNDDG
ncbi:hypothetical protein BC835DRAFT_1267577 [Cytidiella melzeri]|nr:hypothetical protein BC835DRAFT_1267577 [Cytidiella melzeri]